MVKNPQQAWHECQEYIRANVTEQQYSTWFEKITVGGFDARSNELVLSVPSVFYCQYIEENFLKVFKTALQTYFDPRIVLVYNYPVDTQHEQHADEASSVIANDNPGQKLAKPRAKDSTAESDNADAFDSQLDSHMSFRTFVEGQSNKLSIAVGRYASEHPRSTKFNPMFIYGPCGCGKTHLINAVGLHTKELYPRLRVLYVSAQTFQTQYTNAVIENKFNDFIAFYQRVDMLIVDDIQEWINSPKTQDTFFHIFDYLYRSGRRVVLASDRPPVALRGMNERLITRFACGVTTEIDRPDVQLCKDILNSFIRHNALTIPEDVVQYIAETANGSVRDLQGVVNSLLAYSIFYSSEIDLKLAEKLIRRSVKVDHEPISINRVTEAVCAYYDVDINEVNGRLRKKNVALARHVAMYLAQKHTEMSASSIGRLIGGRDHSTVLHSCSLVEKRIKEDSDFANQISTIEKDIKE